MSLVEPQTEPASGYVQAYAPATATASGLQAPDATPLAPTGPEALVALRALVLASTYRASLTPILADIERVALLNLQVRDALEALAARPGFAPAGLLRRTSAEERTVKAFLEYIAFASPAFLGSVGEWPLGQVRG